jgi:MFS family permease
LAATLGGNRAIAGGLVVMSLLGTAAVASLIVRDAEPRVLMVRGSLLLIAGVTVTLAGVYLGSIAALYAGSVIAGLGLGPAFSAVVRSLVPLVLPQERGALLAAVYVVVYVSFSVPAIVAGAATNAFGLRAATYGYGVVVIVLAALTALMLALRENS